MKSGIWGLVFAVIAGVGLEAQAPPLTFTSIDFPGASFTAARDINNAGQIVGEFQSIGLHGFLLDGGVFTQIDVSGSTQTHAYGINGTGDIAGGYVSGPFHGFVLSAGGGTSTIDYPAATATVARDINDSSAVVGDYDDGTTTHGFLRSGGAFSTIDPPGSTFTVAHGINNANSIVGDFSTATANNGFLLSGGVYTTIAFPGALSTDAFGINNLGDIVGSYNDPTGPHGFLLSGGVFSTIDFPGAVSTIAYGINDNGEIVGTYFDGTSSHGFLATAEPCPFVAGVASTRNAQRGSNARPEVGILQTLRRFRDEVMSQGAEGVQHIELFYRHAPAVTWQLLRDSTLREQLRELLVRTSPTLRARLAGRRAAVSRDTLRDISALVDAVATKINPRARADLLTLRGELLEGSILERYGLAVEPGGRDRRGRGPQPRP